MNKNLTLLACLLLAISLWAIEPARTVNLYTTAPAESNGFTDQDEWVKDGHKIHQIATPRIDLYLPSDCRKACPVLLSIPGGGYKYVSSGNEGVDVATFFCPRGIAVAVLKYRLPNGHENIPLADACRAMEMLRDSAEAWNLKADKIGVMGFSAGGHLTASLCTKYTSEKARPDYGILVYPVICADSTIWHKGSFLQLLGENPSPEQFAAWSIDQHVTNQTPPCLVVACEDDKTVPVENSIRMYEALRQQQVETELVLVPEGKHGWGFSRQFPKRDLVDAAITQFIYAQLGVNKNAEIVCVFNDDIRQEESSKEGYDRSEQIRQDLLNPNLNRVMVASHRADWRGFPENSLAAIESAIQIGVDIVELDLQLTADNQLIIMHDKTLNRTTTGKGKIAELTLDSIRQFTLKNGCSIQTNHPIPTLREVLELCKGRVMINLDKADRYFDQVVPLLEETGTSRQIIMKGRKPADEVRQLYGKYLDEVIYMPVLDMDSAKSLEQFKAHLKSQPCAFELCFRADDQYVKQAAEWAKGKSLIWINTLWDTLCGGHEDDKALMESPDAHYGYLINTLGAHIIQTDRPAFLIDYLQKNNLW